MSGLQERASKERKKGLAVRAQRSIWESGLELRILLQKALQSGNRLPQPEGHRVAVTVDPKLETGLKGLARDAAAVVDDLLGLLSSMEEQHPAIEEAAKAAGVESTKRKHPDNDAEKDEEKQEVSDKLWSQLDESYQRFIPFRDASIDRWHRKTVLASGSAARAGLKVLNQSVSSQVQLLMRDSQRVVERTRLPKRLCRPLCSTEEDQVSRENFDRVGVRGTGSFTC
jgi:protein AATF/BFR2